MVSALYFLKLSKGPKTLIDFFLNSIPVDCKEDEDCNVLIQGNLTAYVNAEAEDEQALNAIECDVITIIQELMMSLSPGEIRGVQNITYLGLPMCKTPAGAFKPTTEETNPSEVLHPGLITAAAVGGMCMVLLGLLVVRQRMSRRREHGTTVDGSGMVKASPRLLSVTVNQNDSHQTFDVTPTSTNPDGNILGISASQDSGSEWGAAHDKSSYIERGQHRANTETTSDDTISFGSGLATQLVSPDPPSMESGESLHFEPNVQEEEHLTYDLRFPFDVTPTSTNPDGNILGISASQDSGSEWGAATDKSSDIERGRDRANMETSHDTISFGSGSATQPVSHDPPSMESGESLHSEPTVQEEEHLTHDVFFQPIIHEEQHLTHEC
jgi:hypothetical protein